MKGHGQSFNPAHFKESVGKNSTKLKVVQRNEIPPKEFPGESKLVEKQLCACQCGKLVVLPGWGRTEDGPVLGQAHNKQYYDNRWARWEKRWAEIFSLPETPALLQDAAD